MVKRVTKRREATSDEFKAMAHPLRLRILRLCLHDSLTNKQIAERVDKDPATVLHHVRLLVDTGFLTAETPRAGARGALEKPYRATGKSWELSIEKAPPDDRMAQMVAVVDAFRAEVLQAGADNIVEWTRAGPKLAPEDVEELAEKLSDLVHEYVEGHEDPDGVEIGIFLGIHRRV